MTMKHNDPYKLAQENGLQYSGDINLEYGGLFFATVDWQAYGYADAVRITDLDSATGFHGGVLIERIAILAPDTPEKLKSCLSVIGAGNEEPTPELVIEAALAYGLYDPVSDFTGPHSEIVTTDPENWEYDGWKAGKHIEAGDLLGYVASEWLK